MKINQVMGVGKSLQNLSHGSGLPQMFSLVVQGVAAAYCNSDFLVVWSSGRPAYSAASSDYLGGIPLPPGGDGACRVRTASSLLTVFKIPLVPTVQVGLVGNIDC